jgi:hypothetical protein
MTQSNPSTGGLVGLAAAGLLAWWAYSSGLLSSLFGAPAAAAPAAPSTPAVVPPSASGAGTNLVPRAPSPAPTPSPTPVAPAATAGGPCNPAGIIAPWLAAVQAAQGATFGLNLPGTLTADQWGYYLNQICTGANMQFHVDPDTLFPGDPNRGGPLNWNAMLGYAHQAGLSGLGIVAGEPIHSRFHGRPFPSGMAGLGIAAGEPMASRFHGRPFPAGMGLVAGLANLRRLHGGLACCP